ncbi:MAG TPA: hypothetical protein VFR49_00890 [Solirubrobacteraceae bacterium]|nr:hypothetical protein [Solirubrobacteraceae bacterium]
MEGALDGGDGQAGPRGELGVGQAGELALGEETALVRGERPEGQAEGGEPLAELERGVRIAGRPQLDEILAQRRRLRLAPAPAVLVDARVPGDLVDPRLEGDRPLARPHAVEGRHEDVLGDVLRELAVTDPGPDVRGHRAAVALDEAIEALRIPAPDARHQDAVLRPRGCPPGARC